ncbi:MAG: aspartate dehydrogenase domain-containing protein [Elusimicrobiota bacterium]
MKKLSIIGCGVIGTEIAKSVDNNIIKNTKIIKLYDINFEKAKILKNYLKKNNPLLTRTLQEAINNTDIIVECASCDAVRQILSIAPVKSNIFILSTGALIKYPELQHKISKKKLKVSFPSGAIAGLDAIKAASFNKIRKVLLVSRKSPVSLGISGNITRRKLLYDGPTSSAIKLFPQNINVAASLSLSGIGPRKTRVKIFADPGLKTNVHEIFVSGDFGTIATRVENNPSKINPKTSLLAVLSAINELKNICED